MLSVHGYHVCRTVGRRAERAVVALAAADAEAQVALEEGVRYLNRLSDLLFVLARLENARGKEPDTAWQKEEAGEGEEEEEGEG